MELGLRLGDAPPPFGFPQKPLHSNVSHIALDFALGFSNSIHSLDHPQQIHTHKPNNILHQNHVVACFSCPPPPSPSPSLPPPPLLQLDLLPRTPVAAASRRSTSQTDLSEAADVITAAPPSATAAEGGGGELPRNPLLLSSLYGGGAAAADGGGIFEVEEGNCDEEDENLGSRKKLRLSREQSAFLEESFKEHHTLYPKQKLELAKRLNLRPRQVEVWFQNRRARTKLKQTEVDCEYLKKCCETLTQQNRKLRKELQDLRALKTTDSLSFMHSPATTLNLCASCERAAASSAGAYKDPATSKGASGFSFTRTGSFPFSPTDLSGHNN